MRRPHRSIETFDISLMAVVTKAMGAFLVLMLLLLPYYMSGQIGQEAADKLNEALKTAQEEIAKLKDSLAKGDPSDLRRRLEEALKRLVEAARLAALFKRDNERLNAQVQRLEGTKTALDQALALAEAAAKAQAAQIEPLRAQIARLTAEIEELRKQTAAPKAGPAQGSSSVSYALTSDCRDVVVALTVWTRNATVTASNGQKSNQVINFDGLGYSEYRRAVNEHPASSYTFVDDFGPGDYVITVTTRNPDATGIMHGHKVRPLKKPVRDCSATLLTSKLTDFSGTLKYVTLLPEVIKLSTSAYGDVVAGLEFDKGTLFDRFRTPEDFAWFNTQIEGAAKLP